MDSITFRINAEVKRQMTDICKELGMTTSTAFNLFANAFVRAKGMPFPVTLHASYGDAAPIGHIPAGRMEEDAAEVMRGFSEDYARMAE